MADSNILSTAEFLSTMKKTPLGRDTTLTFGDAQALSLGGIDTTKYEFNATNEYTKSLEEETQEDAQWWEKMFGAIDNAANRFGTGFATAFEGLVDAGATIVSNIMSWAGADTQYVDDFIKIDVGENLANFTESFANFTPWGIGKMIDNASKYGDQYWQDMGRAWSSLGLGVWSVDSNEIEEWKNKYAYSHDLLEEETGWFGDVALGVFEAGGQLVAQWLTHGMGTTARLGLMGVSAFGQGTEEGLQEGADIHTSSIYGLLSGATEIATEKIGGIGADIDTGIVGKMLRKSKIGTKFLNSVSGQFIGNFVAEGLEEVMSDAVNPLWKKLTIDPDMDLGEEYKSADFWGGLGTSFVVGGLAGGIVGGIKGYKANKTSINGKKVGLAGVNALNDYNDAAKSYQTKVEKAVKQFSDMVGENIDVIQEGDIRVAMQDAIQNKNFSEVERNKLKRLIDQASKGQEAFNKATERFESSMEELNITEQDLAAEYQESKNRALRELAKRYEVETTTADLSQEGTSFVIDGDNLTLDSTTADELTASSAAMVINNDSLIASATQLASESSTQNWERIADARNLSGEQRQQFIDKNRTVEVVRAVAEGAGLDLNDKNTADIVADALENSTTTEGAVNMASFEAAQLPKTSGRHNIGNKEVAKLTKQKFSAGFASVMNKIYDDSYSVRTVLKNMGVDEAHTNEIIRRVRSSAGVANSVSQTGFFDVVYENGRYQIKNKTKGLYNGKDGILDIMKEYAKSKNMDFENVNSLVQEGLSLLDEQDRGKVTYDNHSLTQAQMDTLQKLHPDLFNQINNGEIFSQEEFENITKGDGVEYNHHDPKTVFGEFYSRTTLTAEQLSRLSQEHNDLYKRIMAGESISEAEFKSIVGNARYNGALLTDAQINERLSQIKKEVTNFDQIKDWVYEINDQVLEMRRSSGMISEEQFNYWKKTKPHYVPEFRVLVGQAANRGNGVRILNTDLHTAKGSNLAIQDIFLSIQSQIEKIHRFNAMNELVNEVYNNYVASGRQVDGIEEVTTAPRVTDLDTELENVSQAFVNGQTIYSYQNGEVRQMRVNPQIAESLNSLNGTLKFAIETSRILAPFRKMAKITRSLMTTLNPFFSWFRNPVKDIQGAVIYTKNGTATLLKNWGRALTQVVSKSELFQVYETLSGQTLVLKDSYQDGKSKSFYRELERGALSKSLRSLSNHYQNANEIMEHTTRFAEFISTFERLTKKGVSYQNAIETALVDANEITLNFSRKGIYTRVLNQYVPFLTANIEGAARNVRAFKTLISHKSAKEWAAFILKLLILGIAPQIIQELIYSDDEDYQDLADTMKSNYYLIKAGNQFIRIPKGFIQQAFAADIVLAKKVANGTVNEKDFKSALSSNWNAIGVDVNGVFFQPIIDASYNTTWYGGEIVSQKWDNTRPENQYTDETSEISKFIGKMLGTSPLKVQYVLDQMTGIVGDIVLPLTARKSNNVLQIFKGQFVTDPAYKNKLSNEFYTYKQEVTFDKTDGDVIAQAVLSYLNKCSTQIQALKTKQDEISQDTSITQVEREEQDRIYQVMMNVCYKEAVANAKALKKELEDYELSELSYDDDLREAVRQSLGAEEALRMAGTRIYTKANVYSRLGVSYDKFYVYYYNMRNMESKEDVINYIARLRLGANLTNLLYRLAGYRLDNEKITLLRAWLKRKGLTEEEIDNII